MKAEGVQTHTHRHTGADVGDETEHQGRYSWVRPTDSGQRLESNVQTFLVSSVLPLEGQEAGDLGNSVTLSPHPQKGSGEQGEEARGGLPGPYAPH